MEQSVVRQRFGIRMPLNWQLHKHYDTHQNSYPYFFGEMQVMFRLPVMVSQYDKSMMDADTTPGRLDTPYEELLQVNPLEENTR